MRRRASSGSHVAIMAAQMHMFPDEASKRFDDTQAEVKQVRNHAADVSAAVASRMSFAAFADLLPGAVAAAVAGALAVQRRVRVTERTVR